MNAQSLIQVQVRAPGHDDHHPDGRTSHHEIDENHGTYRVATESGKIREVSWMERNERHLTQRTWKVGEVVAGGGVGEKGGGVPKHAAPHPSFYQRVHPDWNKDTGEESHYATWEDQPDQNFKEGMYRQDANFYGQEGDYRKKEAKKHKFRNVVFRRV